jgi:hypothetical protein
MRRSCARRRPLAIDPAGHTTACSGFALGHRLEEAFGGYDQWRRVPVETRPPISPLVDAHLVPKPAGHGVFIPGTILDDVLPGEGGIRRMDVRNYERVSGLVKLHSRTRRYGAKPAQRL